jgi:TPR repeat protein
MTSPWTEHIDDRGVLLINSDKRIPVTVHMHWLQDEPETSDEISIGHMYEYGEYVQQDYATALYWYQLAANTRDTVAEAAVRRVKLLLKPPH